MHAVLYLTNVNVNTPLTQFNGFCKVVVATKACPDICRIYLFFTCSGEPNSTTLSDVKCCSLSLCIFIYQQLALRQNLTCICVAMALLLFAHCQVDGR